MKKTLMIILTMALMAGVATAQDAPETFTLFKNVKVFNGTEDKHPRCGRPGGEEQDSQGRQGHPDKRHLGD